MRRVLTLLAALAVTGFALAQAPSANSQGSEQTKSGDQTKPSAETGPKAAKREPFHPNAIAVPVSPAIPGAIVCKDLASVRLVAALYANYWEDAMQDAMTNGASKIIRGPSAPAPKPSDYGCFLVSTGTPVQVANSLPGILTLTARTPDGHTLHGVTQSNMVGRLPEEFQPDGPTTNAAVQPSGSAKTGDQAGGATNEPVKPGTNGVGFPSCIYCPDPSFPEQERARTMSGTVVLRIVVGVDGRAGDIQITNSLGHDLDEAALNAVKKWRFKPAVGPNGVPVPVLIPVEITFRSIVKPPNQ